MKRIAFLLLTATPIFAAASPQIEELRTYFNEQLEIMKAAPHTDEYITAINDAFSLLSQNHTDVNSIYDYFLNMLASRAEERNSIESPTDVLFTYPDLIHHYPVDLWEKHNIAAKICQYKVLLKALSLSSKNNPEFAHAVFFQAPSILEDDLDSFIDKYFSLFLPELQAPEPLEVIHRHDVICALNKPNTTRIMMNTYLQLVNQIKSQPHLPEHLESAKKLLEVFLRDSGSYEFMYKCFTDITEMRVNARYDALMRCTRTKKISFILTYPHILKHIDAKYYAHECIALYTFQHQFYLKAVEVFANLIPNIQKPYFLMDPSRSTYDMDTFIDKYSEELFADRPETLRRAKSSLNRETKKYLGKAIKNQTKAYITPPKPAKKLTIKEAGKEQQRLQQERQKKQAAENARRKAEQEEAKIREASKPIVDTFPVYIAPETDLALPGRAFVADDIEKEKTRGIADPLMIPLEGPVIAGPSSSQQTALITLQRNHFETYEAIMSNTPGLKYPDIKAMFERLGGAIDESTASSHVDLTYQDSHGNDIRRKLVKNHGGNENGFWRTKRIKKRLEELLGQKNIDVACKGDE